MKINEVIITELFGLKRQMNLRRAAAAGAKDMQATADKLEREFASYLGGQGKRINNSSWDDVLDFLSSKNVDVSQIDTTMPLNTNKVFKDVAIKAKSLAGRRTPPTPTPGPGPGRGTPSTPTPGRGTPPASSTSAYSQTLGSAQKLSAKEKRRLIQQLQKGLPPTKVPPVPLGGGRTTP